MPSSAWRKKRQREPVQRGLGECGGGSEHAALSSAPPYPLPSPHPIPPTSFVNHPSHCFLFFNDTATTEIYTLSLHDALPISVEYRGELGVVPTKIPGEVFCETVPRDRKSTRLNSSHRCISYAVFCLKKN